MNKLGALRLAFEWRSRNFEITITNVSELILLEFFAELILLEFFAWLSSTSKEGLRLFGINYREFRLSFELLPPSWNSSYCTGARVTMVISPGHSYLIAIFGAETELVSQLW